MQSRFTGVSGSNSEHGEGNIVSIITIRDGCPGEVCRFVIERERTDGEIPEDLKKVSVLVYTHELELMADLFSDHINRRHPY